VHAFRLGDSKDLECARERLEIVVDSWCIAEDAVKNLRYFAFQQHVVRFADKEFLEELEQRHIAGELGRRIVQRRKNGEVGSKFLETLARLALGRRGNARRLTGHSLS
jgi:hypothetical protein